MNKLQQRECGVWVDYSEHVDKLAERLCEDYPELWRVVNSDDVSHVVEVLPGTVYYGVYLCFDGAGSYRHIESEDGVLRILESSHGENVTKIKRVVTNVTSVSISEWAYCSDKMDKSAIDDLILAGSKCWSEGS